MQEQPRKNKGGRPKGALNRTTASVRETIARVAERRAEDVERWLIGVAANDPAKALDLYLRMIEYHIPKLSRAEVTGEDGGALIVKVVQFGNHAAE